MSWRVSYHAICENQLTAATAHCTLAVLLRDAALLRTSPLASTSCRLLTASFTRLLAGNHACRRQGGRIRGGFDCIALWAWELQP